MSRKISAGILLFRLGPDGTEVLLAHPGGPFFVNRDLGHWTIPKGEPGDEDDLFLVGCREFEEETGSAVEAVRADPAEPPSALGTVTQASGKVVHAWAIRGDLDPAAASSNTFEMEWPPGSKQRGVFPEIDRVAWFAIDAARRHINPSQAAFIDRMVEHLGSESPPTT